MQMMTSKIAVSEEYGIERLDSKIHRLICLFSNKAILILNKPILLNILRRLGWTAH